MAKENFDQAFAFTIGIEKGYVNNPRDRGGPTKYGVTQATLSKWIRRPASIDDVKNLKLDTAHEIFKAWYWDAMSLDGVKGPIDACMFDIGIVSGISIPPKFAQSICNAHGSHLIEDGHLGPKSLEAINAMDTAVFIRDFSVKTENRFRAIVAHRPSQMVFLKGWLNRAHRLLQLI